MGLVAWFIVFLALSIWSYRNGRQRGWTFIAAPHVSHVLAWLWMAVLFGIIASGFFSEGKAGAGVAWCLLTLWPLHRARRVWVAWRRGEHTEY